ncbi:MAG: hypothetical protein GW836_12405 [Paraglaciecola sp.]|nr:hypothetical protein [Paraglaciecola sp.]
MRALYNFKQTFTYPLYLLLFMATMFTTSPAKASLISLETDTSSVFLGEQIDVNIWIRDLGSEFVSAFSLDLLVDTSLVSVNAAGSLFGDKLGGGIDSIQDVFDLGGIINVAELSFLLDAELDLLQQLAGTRVDFLLATLVFDTTALGVANFSLDFDPLFGGVVGEAGALLNSELPLQALQVAIVARPINPVPAPSTLGMLLSLAAIVLCSVAIRKGETLARMARS